MSPLVSVVVPFFEQEPFVLPTVQSLLSQSYENLQIIAVDDGSSDNGLELLQSITDPRLKLIRQDNQGPSAALNTGLLNAEGEYVALLGGDDVAAEDRIAKQLNVLEGSDADLVFCHPALIDEAGNPLDDHHYSVLYRETGHSPTHRVFNRLFFRGNYFCAPSVMLRRNVIDKVGLFHHGLLQLQDFDYWIRACKNGFKFWIGSERLIFYRRRKGDKNLSSKRNQDRTRFEHSFILRRYFQHCPDWLIKDAFSDEICLTPYDTPEARRVDTAMIYLFHSNESARQIGYEAIMEMLESKENRDDVERRYGFSATDLFEILQQTKP